MEDFFITQVCLVMLVSVILFYWIKKSFQTSMMSVILYHYIMNSFRSPITRRMYEPHDIDWAESVIAAEQGEVRFILQALEREPDLIYTTDAAGDTVLHVLAKAGKGCVITITRIKEVVGKHRLERVMFKWNMKGDTALDLVRKKNELVLAYFWMNLLDSDAAASVSNEGRVSVPRRITALGDSDKVMELEWIETIPKGVRKTFLQASSKVISAEQIQLEMDQFGGNILHVAAKLGRVDLLILLVESMSSCELATLTIEKNLHGNSPLHLALNDKREAAALYLVQVAPKVAYLPNQQGVSPLFLAIQLGYLDLVRHAFQQMPGTEIDSSLKNSLLTTKEASIVHAAVKDRKIGILDIILKELPASIDSLNREGWRPLSYAAFKGYLDVVRYFLNKFPDSVTKYDIDGSLPIHKAIGAGHVCIVKEFLSSCPSTMYGVDKKGRSLLHIAVCYVKDDVFAYLTKKKLEIKKKFRYKNQMDNHFEDSVEQLCFGLQQLERIGRANSENIWQ